VEEVCSIDSEKRKELYPEKEIGRFRCQGRIQVTPQFFLLEKQTNGTFKEGFIMKPQHFMVAVFAFIIIPFSSGCDHQIALGYDPQKADELYQHGLYKEQVEKDLLNAIKIYEKIVNKYPLNIWIAAKARVHILRCYLEWGKQKQQRPQAAEVSFLRNKKAPEKRTSF